MLITSTLAEGTGSISARGLLSICKDQQTVERNFGFLVGPLFVNALFLKSLGRIEAVGLLLILALMIWFKERGVSPTLMAIMDETRIMLKEARS